MSENKQFYIHADGQRVEVTEEVYRAYYKMGRRERYLEERDASNGKVLYSDMDTTEMTGEESIPDLDSVSIDDSVVSSMLLEQLRKHLDSLSDSERELIDALFFSNDGDGMSEREYAVMSGIPRKTISDRKNRILAKLKKLLET